MYRVLISGDRDWSVSDSIRRILRRLVKEHGTDLIVIGGGAPGADTICKIACHDLSIHFAEVKALWDTRHKSAGPQRNTAMLGLDPHELIAFHADLANSRGTKNMILQATKAGVPYRLITE